MKNVIYVIFLATVFACQQDMLKDEVFAESYGQGISLTKDNFLRFESRQSLESFMKSKDDDSKKTRGAELDEKQEEYDDEIFCVPEDFETISKLKRKISCDVDDDDSEMSFDEVNVVKAENLLIDPMLTEVMDTTLRVQIADTIYKVCEYGTFAATSLEKIENAIANFDSSFITEETPLMVELGNGVKFINTFGGKEEDLSSVYVDSIADDGMKCSITRSGDNSETLQLHTSYNVTTYKWKNNSFFEQILDIL